MTSGRHLSFQAKVLIPIVTLLVVLLSLTMWLVNSRLTAQMKEDAKQKVLTAEGVFRNSLEIRSRNLLLRYQNLVNEPRFKAVAQLGEPKTMTVLLNELLVEIDAQMIAYHTASGDLLAVAPRPGSSDFSSNRSTRIDQALKGQATSETVTLENQLFNIISMPVLVADNIVGVLTIGVKIDENAAREMKSLTHSEIALLSGSQVLVSTLEEPQLYPQLVDLFRNERSRSSGKMGQFVTPSGEHFVCVAGQLPVGTASEAGYLLLSSFTKALQQMQATQRTLWGLGIVGILSSCLFVAALIRKIMRPMQQLHESAEAVGRGDFTRHVEVQTKDEFGELASAFNRMMENLAASRAQAETAMKSLQDAQTQLIQTEKLSAIGEFVAGVAHELNNPLTAVVGFSEMLQDSEVPESQQAFAKRIVEGAERCHRIVQSLLSFARQHAPERKWVHIDRLMETVIEIVNYELRTGNIEVVTDFSPDVPRLLLDPHQMQQVFLNIINNARQAIEEHQPSGQIRISSQLAGKSVRIRFEDNGPGIDPEHLARIFDPFFTTKPMGLGTGLGLSLSYGIVREHGGTISVHSKPGAGAIFIVELPVRSEEKDALSEKAETPAPAAIPSSGAGINILVIDDEEAILDLLKEALGRKGYEVDIAKEGTTAIQQFQQNHYDLIVCDWKIPGLGGQQIFEQLCKLDSGTAERFIFMTGDSLNPKAQEFLWTHNRPCLLKPFSVEELHSTIRKVLAAV